jgi:hypothetical protein
VNEHLYLYILLIIQLFINDYQINDLILIQLSKVKKSILFDIYFLCTLQSRVIYQVWVKVMHWIKKSMLNKHITKMTHKLNVLRLGEYVVSNLTSVVALSPIWWLNLVRLFHIAQHNVFSIKIIKEEYVNSDIVPQRLWAATFSRLNYITKTERLFRWSMLALAL